MYKLSKVLLVSAVFCSVIYFNCENVNCVPIGLLNGFAGAFGGATGGFNNNAGQNSNSRISNETVKHLRTILTTPLYGPGLFYKFQKLNTFWQAFNGLARSVQQNGTGGFSKTISYNPGNASPSTTTTTTTEHPAEIGTYSGDLGNKANVESNIASVFTTPAAEESNSDTGSRTSDNIPLIHVANESDKTATTSKPEMIFKPDADFKPDTDFKIDEDLDSDDDLKPDSNSKSDDDFKPDSSSKPDSSFKPDTNLKIESNANPDIDINLEKTDSNIKIDINSKPTDSSDQNLDQILKIDLKTDTDSKPNTDSKFLINVQSNDDDDNNDNDSKSSQAIEVNLVNNKDSSALNTNSKTGSGYVYSRIQNLIGSDSDIALTINNLSE